MVGRVMLVKTLISNMLTYTIIYHPRHVTLLRDIEKDARNFIWSGALNKRKLVVAAQKKMCRPITNGGLGLRYLLSLNEVANLKISWDLLTSKEDWAIIIKGRVFISNDDWKFLNDCKYFFIFFNIDFKPTCCKTPTLRTLSYGP